jgi:deazaflavin-dependent oxidoreductase (nitroreductase family)
MPGSLRRDTELRWPSMNQRADAQYCYLTTTGRVSGRPHTVEIWFARRGATVYLLSGGGERADWVRNLRRRPEVAVRFGRRNASELPGHARVLDQGTAEDELARDLLVEKYQPGYGGDLSGWRRSSLPVAIDLEGGADG